MFSKVLKFFLVDFKVMNAVINDLSFVHIVTKFPNSDEVLVEINYMIDFKSSPHHDNGDNGFHTYRSRLEQHCYKK